VVLALSLPTVGKRKRGQDTPPGGGGALPGDRYRLLNTPETLDKSSKLPVTALTGVLMVRPVQSNSPSSTKDFRSNRSEIGEVIITIIKNYLNTGKSN